VARKLAALSRTSTHADARISYSRRRWRRLGKEISSRSELVGPIAAREDCDDNHRRPFCLILAIIISRAFTGGRRTSKYDSFFFFFVISPNTIQVFVDFCREILSPGRFEISHSSSPRHSTRIGVLRRLRNNCIEIYPTHFPGVQSSDHDRVGRFCGTFRKRECKLSPANLRRFLLSSPKPPAYYYNRFLSSRRGPASAIYVSKIHAISLVPRTCPPVSNGKYIYIYIS